MKILEGCLDVRACYKYTYLIYLEPVICGMICHHSSVVNSLLVRSKSECESRVLAPCLEALDVEH